ncbi:capsule biosynthesis GfcC family protein [Vibrio atypicus]|uniref:capsule biosynthesis GfcC family protein n=1 Tax=Vibrio atypicus TaxID=558271 RepID=UPI00373531D7
MKKILTYIFCSLVLLSSQSYANSIDTSSSLSLKLWYQDKTLNFPDATRLGSALLTSQTHGLVYEYPLATSIFDESEPARAKIANLKYSVLYSLIELDLADHPLYKFIESQQFGKRVVSNVDIDNVRLQNKENPLLSGNYSLASPKRTDIVWLLGDIRYTQSFKRLTRLPFEEQKASISKIIGKKINSIVLIYPDGHTVKPEIGYWLNNQYYIPPMTIIYVPFDHNDASTLNNNIIKLLTSLKMPQ